LKEKCQYVNETCYKFIDTDAGMVEYYDDEGIMIESRPANADELQRNLFQDLRKNGTENQ